MTQGSTRSALTTPLARTRTPTQPTQLAMRSVRPPNLPTHQTNTPAGTWRPGCEIRMLYDGQCSLCMKEVNFLRKRDAAAGRIDFVDIDSPDYTAEANAGITYEQVGVCVLSWCWS